MKLILKGILSLFLILVLVLAGAIVTSNFWLGGALAATIRQVTGLPTTIDRVKIDLQKTEFGAYGIKIKNPKGFPKGNLTSIPEIFVDFDMASFFKGGKLHFEVIRLNLEEFSIIKNADGATNLDQLKTLKKDKAEAVKSKPAKPKTKQVILIDQLVLTIGTVRYVDDSLPVPVNRSVDIGIHQEVFEGITNPADIVRLVLMKILYSASIGNLGLPVDVFKQQFGPSLVKGQEALTRGAELARTMGTQVIGEGRKFVEDAATKIPTTLPVPAEVNQITEDVKGKASGLFKGAEKFLKTTTNTISEKVGEKSNSGS